MQHKDNSAFTCTLCW